MIRILCLMMVLTLSAGSALAQGKPVTVHIGWNPFAGTTPISGTMQQQKLFEKHAAKYGYDVTVDWQQFMAGPPANEAMAAGRLDMDIDFASAALTSRIVQGVPFVIFGVHASHISNALVTRPGSSIDDVAKLQGKTVGAPIGTSAHYVLASIVGTMLGKSLRDAGINVVNMPPADGIKMPSGIDAAAVWVPFRFEGPSLGTAELLVDGDGLTGKAYKPAGIRLPQTEKAWGWPEGFLIDRLYLSARAGFAKEHPDLLRAFLEARWEAQKLTAADPEKALKIANAWWKLEPAIAQQAMETYPENLNIRNAPLALEADALAVIKSSEFLASLGMIDTPLSWNDIKPVFLGGAAVEKQVWQEGGSTPSVDELQKGFHGSTKYWPDLTIRGGAPVWMWGEIPDWGVRTYKAGPFAAKG